MVWGFSGVEIFRRWGSSEALEDATTAMCLRATTLSHLLIDPFFAYFVC